MRDANLSEVLRNGHTPEKLHCPNLSGLKIAWEAINLAKSRGAEVYIYGSAFHHPVHELAVIGDFADDIDMFYLNRFIEDKKTKTPQLDLRVTDTAKAFDDPHSLPFSYTSGFVNREIIFMTNRTNPGLAYASHNQILTPNLLRRLDEVLR